MNLDEALAVYLYLRNQVPGTRDERAYKAAWDIISRYAERTIGTGRRVPADEAYDGSKDREDPREVGYPIEHCSGQANNCEQDDGA